MSTDKPTPETDAKSSTREIRNLNAFWTVEEVPAKFARSLERQRDEYARQLAEVTRERDALRQCFAEASHDAGPQLLS